MRAVWKHYRPTENKDTNGLNIQLDGLVQFDDFVYLPGFIECFHYRKGKSDWTPANNGGFTICYLYDDDKSILSTGDAECSIKDQFCYRIGRDISYGRAMRALEKRLEKGIKGTMKDTRNERYHRYNNNGTYLG